jgi:hypothetical protein
VTEIQLVPNPFVAPFKTRHPSVQKWYNPVLKHIGEDVRGEVAVWQVGGTFFCHPTVFKELLIEQIRYKSLGG